MPLMPSGAGTHMHMYILTHEQKQFQETRHALAVGQRTSGLTSMQPSKVETIGMVQIY